MVLTAGGDGTMPQFHKVTEEADNYIWSLIVARAGVEFKTARGLPFTYRIKRNKDGAELGEMVIDRKNGRTITRSTVLLAYKRAVELGTVSGPKKLGVFGASYLYPIFLEIGVCRK